MIAKRYHNCLQPVRKKVFMAGFGIGLSWGITSAEIDTAKVFPVIKTKDWYVEGKISPTMLM